MPLHLVKLCVGVDSVQDLRDWQVQRLAELRAAGKPPELFHRTTQTPRRAAEIVEGGSLYWVIKGMVLVRQAIIELRPGSWDDGRACCAIILDPELVLTRPQHRRAFQGWRYLEAADAPADAGAGGMAEEDIPFQMAQELRELCLLEG